MDNEKENIWIESLEFTHRGKDFIGKVAFFGNLNAAVSTLGEEKVMELFNKAYVEDCKINIRKRKKKYLKLKLEDLSLDQLEALKSIGVDV